MFNFFIFASIIYTLLVFILCVYFIIRIFISEWELHIRIFLHLFDMYFFCIAYITGINIIYFLYEITLL